MPRRPFTCVDWIREWRITVSPASNAVYGCCCSGVVVGEEAEEFVAVALLFSIFLCVLILRSLLVCLKSLVLIVL